MNSKTKVIKQNLLISIVTFTFIALALITLSFYFNKSINLNNTNSRLNSTTLNSLSISSTTLPNGTICTLTSLNCSNYYFALQASGGTSPYNFSIVSGSLPYGISLSSSGAISGTAYFFDQPGVYNFQVQVEDSASNVATAYLSLDLLNPTSNLTITTSTLPSLNGCTIFTSCPNYYTTLSATGGTSPYSFSIVSGTLPYGISLNSDGAISGTPYFFDQLGIYNFQVQVKDSASNVAFKNLSLDLL